TPYQAEVSQGRLEALLNYQQMVCDLTAMDLANASLLDEATAAAEAMAMTRRLSRSKAAHYFVDADCHPQTLGVLRTRAEPLGIEIIVGDIATDLDPAQVFGALLQYPASSGAVSDHTQVAERLHASGALLTVASDLLALCLLRPPGEWGADIVVGNAQRFGVPLGYGGPHAAFFATRDGAKRAMPGRVIGVSIDSAGRPALRMALQTREQHIRREKATSNICTAQVLLANMAGFYAIYHGADGVRRIAERTHRLCGVLREGLSDLGFDVVNSGFFDTLTVGAPGQAQAVVTRALEVGINLRQVNADRFAVACDETTTRAEIMAVLGAAAGDEGAARVRQLDVDTLDARAGGKGIEPALRRTSAYLEHPVFSAHRCETEMLRYLRRLQAKDIALDRAMIPLGSCTMKLNAVTEMQPVSLPGFARIHPLAPANQVRGYRQLFDDLEAWLCTLTGFDAVSLQPNAGSQGEYAGLLCIRRYHASRGEAHRNVCLIPSSAHGTNPASAIMAGMRVIVVKCDEHGNVDLDDLSHKAGTHAQSLAALMITYPSTHGVFEEDIKRICDVVHEHGGQVYMDGANLNAMIGLCRPASLGADVSHMNLHKTFCIPHGGGGPGMGPIGVKAQLAPFLPGHVLMDEAAGSSTAGAVSAAPFGSASILPISWAYIAMMGAQGLRRATEIAILSANYIAERLAPHYPVLYRGAKGRVAHECIVDLRPIKADCGISVDDVAKRLIDYGFHAPTMSWPVADTLMIEPTESEPRHELDRFCDAMIAIRQEISAVESGQADAEDNVLKHAPHTADLLVGEWRRPYDKQLAFFPSASARADKYWPPVGRVDNVYGDKNLVCSCPPLEAYEEAAQ
ncbi:MAG: aminomethyl-transferring glycine dehydrogenase, partial [Gammaproteobacteria bacterium]